MTQLISLFNKIIKSLKNNFNQIEIFDDILLYAQPIKLENNVLYISSNNDEKIKVWKTLDEEKISSTILATVGQNIKLLFLSNDEIKKHKLSTLNNEIENLDINLTFDNYIEGEFNKKTLQLLNRILKNPNIDKSIFIYGQTGLGKTHLVSAFLNKFMQLYPNKKVCYINTNTFVSKTTNAIKNANDIEEFKKIYSSYDLFIFEDVQNLHNKFKTNEIFFTIYNNLLAMKKIIILTCDQHIDLLTDIEPRLISRFGSGYTLKINPPDQESLIKIFNLHAKKTNIKLLDDALLTIVSYYKNDIRRLLGVINNLILFSNDDNNNHVFSKQEVIDLLELQYGGKEDDLSLNPNYIINKVCAYYHKDPIMITSKSQKKEIADVRNICIYIIRLKTKLTYKAIGNLFSNRDHSSIMTSEKKIINKIQSDPTFKDALEILINKI